MQGERATVSEGGCFTAGVTFSHVRFPFLTMIPRACRRFIPFEGRAFYHITQPTSRLDVKIDMACKALKPRSGFWPDSAARCFGGA
jgi:hypothetical protein